MVQTHCFNLEALNQMGTAFKLHLEIDKICYKSLKLKRSLIKSLKLKRSLIIKVSHLLERVNNVVVFMLNQHWCQLR